MSRRDATDAHWYPGNMQPGTLIYRRGQGSKLHLNPKCCGDEDDRKKVEAMALPPAHRDRKCNECWEPQELVDGRHPKEDDSDTGSDPTDGPDVPEDHSETVPVEQTPCLAAGCDEDCADAMCPEHMNASGKTATDGGQR